MHVVIHTQSSVPAYDEAAGHSNVEDAATEEDSRPQFPMSFVK